MDYQNIGQLTIEATQATQATQKDHNKSVQDSCPISTSTLSPKIEATFEYRSHLSSAIRTKYPDRCPIIVEISKGGNLHKRNIRLTKNKFLTSHDSTLAQFVYTFKKGKFLDRLDEQEAIFFFFDDNTIPSNSTLMGDLYKTYQEDDGFLYVKVDTENTFG